MNLCLGISLCAGTRQIRGEPPEPRTLYFVNGAADNDWNTPGNWWLDDPGTVPGGGIPADGDTVYIYTDAVLTPPSAPVSLAYLEAAQDVNLDGVTARMFVFIGSSTVGGHLVGLASFLGNNQLDGEVTGDAGFEAMSRIGSEGVVNGNATFLGTAGNSGVVNGDAIFNENSRNFYGFAGTVNGNVTVYYPSPYPVDGIVMGSVSYAGYPTGCTDPSASNYNPAAVVDDGTCLY